MEITAKPAKFPDEELLEGLRRHDNRCIGYLYTEYLPVVRHHIHRNSGGDRDTEDIFQDALLILYRQCRSGSLRLTCSLKTYLMAIVKNLWNQRLDERYRLAYTPCPEVHESQARYAAGWREAREDDLERERLFHKNLMQMPDDCRRLLQLYCRKVSHREIASILHYSDEQYVKTRKYLCKNMLRKRILSDPECRPYVRRESCTAGLDGL